jgi:hypothetical protein
MLHKLNAAYLEYLGSDGLSSIGPGRKMRNGFGLGPEFRLLDPNETGQHRAQ